MSDKLNGYKHFSYCNFFNNKDCNCYEAAIESIYRLDKYTPDIKIQKIKLQGNRLEIVKILHQLGLKKL